MTQNVLNLRNDFFKIMLMLYIEFVLTIVALSSGFVALSLLFFLYRKFRIPLIKYSLLFITPFHIAYIFNFVEIYIKTTNPQYNLFPFITAWNALAVSCAFYLGPYTVYKLIEKPFSVTMHLLFLFLALLRLGQGALILVFGGQWFIYIGNSIEIILMSYLVVILFMHKNRISIPELKSFFNEFLIASICLVALLLPVYFLYDIGNFKPFFDILAPFRTFYIAINILIIKATYLYFAKQASGGNIPKTFIDQFGISNRETEIIDRLIQGFSAKKIGEKLFITTQTVKNHIYKIYQKAEVNNKVEFINVLQSKTFKPG